MSDVVYTVGFPFCGLGGGARGFLDARVEILGKRVGFKSVGGIDLDADACKDFVYLTDSPALCADVAQVTPAQLRDFMGARAPDVIFLSAPCKGSSKLLSEAKAKDPRYEALNLLSEVWIDLMLATWAEPPKLVLFENVPNITSRAKAMLRRVKARLRRAGYVLHDGFHECGTIGGLAQRRKRWLLVARHPARVPTLLLQPPAKRVRGCGEVLGELPLPGDPAAGPMHRLPAISWLNWVRLALIPAGGDWRDLHGVLDGRARREVFKRHGVEAWDAPTGTVAGTGSNGVANVADPRVDEASERAWFGGTLGVQGWEDTSATVTGRASPSTGRFSVADPRVDVAPSWGPNAHHNKYVVRRWDQAASTVIGATRPGSGAPSVADPRVQTGFDRAYAVVPWTEPTNTIAGGSHPGQGTYSVADPRLDCTPRAGAYGVLPWDEAAKTITGAAGIDNGAFAVADPRLPDDAPPILVVRDVREKMRTPPPVILAEDGTWHRPMTTLELAALQGLPTVWKGKPLVLAGRSTGAWRERIGNAVPVGAAEAIAREMLLTLTQADAGIFALSSGGAIWVTPAERGEGATP